MPGTLMMVSGVSARPKRYRSQVLSMPIRGWSRNSQPIAEKKLGMKMPIVMKV